jgi:hypothetical protein
MMEASSSTERATLIRRPQPQEQARALRERPGPPGLACSARRHRTSAAANSGPHLGVMGGGLLGDAGRRPANRLHVGHVQAELAGQGGIAAIEPA